MTSPTPLWPPMAMTSLEQMPPLPGPVTSITAPFYDASFRCQVCLLLTGGCGVTLIATEHEGPKPYISLSSIWGSVGSGPPNNSDNGCMGLEDHYLVICHMCVGHTLKTGIDDDPWRLPSQSPTGHQTN